MPLLQVKDFPEDIYEEITFAAHRQNRTIAQQTVILIKKGLAEEWPDKERRKLAIERTFARDVPQGAKSMNHLKFIREDRDR